MTYIISARLFHRSKKFAKKSLFFWYIYVYRIRCGFIQPPRELHLRSPSGWPAVVKVEEKLIVERCFHRGKLCREINFREKETRSVLLIDRERIYLFVQFPRSIAIRPRITHTGIRDTASLYCPRGMRVPLSRFVSNLSIFMTRRISRRVVERVVLSCSARVIKERKIAHDEQISSSFMLDERAARYTHVWKGKELSLAEE